MHECRYSLHLCVLSENLCVPCGKNNHKVHKAGTMYTRLYLHERHYSPPLEGWLKAGVVHDQEYRVLYSRDFAPLGEITLAKMPRRKARV